MSDRKIPKVGDRFIVSRVPGEHAETFDDYENGDTGVITGVEVTPFGEAGITVRWETNRLDADELGRCTFLFAREITVLDEEEEHG